MAEADRAPVPRHQVEEIHEWPRGRSQNEEDLDEDADKEKDMLRFEIDLK